jgi:hypothetical protein
MAAESGLTRAQLVRRAAGGALGIALASCGSRRVTGTARAAPAAPPPAGDVFDFVSRPDLKPPVVSVLRNRGTTAPGLLFLAPSSGPGQRGALIADDRFEPVWFHPTTPVTAMNVRAAMYQGKPVLTWWEGTTAHGLGRGSHVILDQTYRVVRRFPAGRGRPSDLHELLLTEQGTVLVTAWEVTTLDLRSLGSTRRHPVIGGVVQELELPSGKVLFEWRSLDHVAPSEAYAKIAPRFDYFHINSIDVDADGNLLVSARNTWTVYKIGRRSGKVIWRLGGKRSDFAMGRGTRFAWQHDARPHPGGLLSIFDNATAVPRGPVSRALVLKLDTRRMRATLQHRYAHTPALHARAMGSAQVLPNGNVLVGWGTEPYVTEYSADGTVLLDARLPRGGQNYRALRFPWAGRPSLPPRLAAPPGGGSSVYASWNGATEVASWQLETGTDAAELTGGGTTQRQGFETALALPQGARYARAVALGRSGEGLGSSAVVRL